MKYILIVVILAHRAGTNVTAEFNNLEACEQTRASIAEKLDLYIDYSECRAKGAER